MILNAAVTVFALESVAAHVTRVLPLRELGFGTKAYDAFDVATFGTVGVRRGSCRGTSGSVALSPSGLRGGSAAPLGNEFECFAPKQVVVRVRAVLAAPGALRAGQDFQSAHVPVREAKLAVRTVTGKPLVYADVSESGRARIFAANGCSQQ